MNHDDHRRLIAGGIGARGGVWADLGSGWGAFTLALRDELGSDAEIWSVDRDAASLRSQREAIERQFPGTRLHQIQGDFSRTLALPPLDGIVAANSIHFVRDRVSLLAAWRRYLKPDGRLILVEYDTDRGNHWVPHPVSFASLPKLARAAGYDAPELINVHPSRFNDRIYGALLKPSHAAPM